MNRMLMRYFVISAALLVLSVSFVEAGESLTGTCVLVEDKPTAPDGNGLCGTWKAVNTIDPDTNEVKKTTLIDFCYITNCELNGRIPETPLTIVYVCVSVGHNSFVKDRLILQTIRGGDPKKYRKSWKLKREELWRLKREKTGCRYVPLRPGMKIEAWITNVQPDQTSSGLSASGTWAIVK